MSIKESCVFFLEHLLGIQEFGNVVSSSEILDASMLVLLVPEEMMALDIRVLFLYTHGSVHRESNLITVQQDATYSVYYISAGSSTYFGC